MNEMDATPTLQQIREEMDTGLARLLTLTDAYSAEQMVVLTDANGWNIRDHLTHLFAWADGMIALLRKEDRWSRMGVSPEAVASRDFDVMNAEIVVKYRHLSPSEARERLITAHKNVIEVMSTLSQAERMLPYGHYAVTFSGQDGPPIYAAVLETTSQHYDEHMPWIKAIAQNHVSAN